MTNESFSLTKREAEFAKLPDRLAVSRMWLKADEQAESKHSNRLSSELIHKRQILRQAGYQTLVALQESNGQKGQTQLLNFDFTFEPVFDPNGNLTYFFSPVKEAALMAAPWGKDLAAIYATDLHVFISKYGEISDKNWTRESAYPLAITVLTPDSFPSSGWVNDFSPLAFVNREGRSNLPGKEKPHSKHETMHRLLSFISSGKYNGIFVVHPYLDESLAILSTLLYVDHNKTGPFSGLPPGNEQMYVNQLNAGTLLNLGRFDFLDGGQRFDGLLYCQRMILGMFLRTLLTGQYSNGNMIKPLKENLKAGWAHLKYTDQLNPDSAFSITDRILFAIRDLSPGADDQDFIRQLFGTSRAELENLYLKYGLANYLIYRLSKSRDPIKFWDEQPPEIQAKLLQGSELAELMHFGYNNNLPEIYKLLNSVIF